MLGGSVDTEKCLTIAAHTVAEDTRGPAELVTHAGTPALPDLLSHNCV
jgi:hypothetical protein